MQEYNANEQESCFVESVKELQSLNKKLARMLLRKEELTGLIIGSLEHEHEGQKTYEHDVWKIEIKTPCVYSLNKALYEKGGFDLPDSFNPIKETKAYTIDKRLCDQYIQEAPEHVRDVLVELIDKKAGKPSVTIKERV